jgi:hypothetical protein
MLMPSPARTVLVIVTLAAVGVMGGCTGNGTSESDSESREVTLADGSTATVWGAGEYGVVLVPDEGEEPADWAALAEEIAANRMTVIAVGAAGSDAERLAAAVDWLLESNAGVERIASIGSGDWGAESLAAWAAEGAVVDQFIMISSDLGEPEVADLGEPSKLFVASADDVDGAAAATRMAEDADGTWNVLLLVPGEGRGSVILASEGGDELIAGVVARLEERR